jgi:UDP-3-O-[3-hydroxymyristoyl] glucosamine N-acyltransferase
MATLTVAELAIACEGIAQGALDKTIRGANSLEAAGPDELSFVSNKKAASVAADSRAGCLIVSHGFDVAGDWSLIRVEDQRSAFARALAKLYPAQRPAPFIHPSAAIAKSAHVPSDCYIGAQAVIGSDVRLGPGSVIYDGVNLGDCVVIGQKATLHPHVTIYSGVEIGARVILHAGCVIGADGFGFVLTGDHYEKFPQVGSVRIEDDVEMGANSCIDRAALGITIIGSGTKLDNLVHIAHNCRIGKHVVIAAQTGLAGGVVVGDYAVIGGQVGIGEKATIATRAVVGSGAGILSSQRVRAGEPVWGTPARPLRQHLKGLANVGRIPELRDAIRKLEKLVASAEGSRSRLNSS